MSSRVLVVSFSPISTDPRVMRQIRALASEHDVAVAGFGPAPKDVHEFYAVPASTSCLPEKAGRAALLLLGLYEAAYWRWRPARLALPILNGKKFDVVIANDVHALPLAIKIAHGAPVIFDGHEYSPKEFENSWRWRLFFERYARYLCRTYLPQTTRSMTVCGSIAEEYRQLCGIDPIVVLNSPPYEDLPVKPVDAKRIRMIHHGIAARARSLERMVDVALQLDERFHLDLMLMPTDPGYLAELKARAASCPRIAFRDPVPMETISRTINEYDIGLFLLPPNNLNYQFALPNKFFEFIQARIAVAIGPSIEMATIAREWGFAVITRDFESSSMVSALNALTAQDIEELKRRSDAAAQELHAGTVARQVRELVALALEGRH